MRNVAKMRNEVIASLVRCNRALANRQRQKQRAIHHQQQQSSSSSSTVAPSSFNAARYLFTSHLLAQKTLHLRASQIVSAFETPFPRESYGHAAGEKENDDIVSAITNGFIGIVVFVLTTFLKLPNQSQDLVVRLVVTVIVSYLMDWHLLLYHLHPVLVLIPSSVCGIVSYFVCKILSTQSQLARVDIQNELSHCENRFEDNHKNNPNVLNSMSSDDEVSDDNPFRDQSRPLDRRTSIQMGLRMMSDALTRLEDNQSNNASSSSGNSNVHV